MNYNEISRYHYEINIVDSKQENVSTVKMNNVYLHSRYKPLEEAKNIAGSFYKKNHLHLLFGLGLGYIAQALLDKLSETDQLLIIEPNLEMLKIALENEENRKLVNDGKVKICAGLDIINVEYLLNSYFQEFMGRFTIITAPNYPNLYPDYYKTLLEKTKEHLMMEVINNNTRHLFSKQWQENFISNLYYAFKAHNIEEIKGKLSCPIVIVSGGPSLTKQLPLLKRVKNHALIMCVGSTINSLLNENITPDLVITVDGGEPNYNHFKNINIDQIPIVYPLIVHKNIPAEHKGEQIVFNISDHTIMNKWDNQLLSRNLGLVQTGHSVANFCFDIAYQLTNAPIALIGQDLAYTNNQSHATGNKGFSMVDEQKVKQRKMFYAEGYYEDEVLTDYVFHGMKKGFEHHLVKLRNDGYNHDVYNCTEGGIKLEGFKQIPFQEFIETYCQIDYSEEINKLIPKKETPSDNKWNEFHQQILQLMERYKEVLTIVGKSINVLSLVKQNDYIFIKDLAETLDELDNDLKKILENEFIYYILRPIIFKVQHSYLEVENESEEDSNKRVYNKSLLLYKGIKDATEQGLIWIEGILEKIEKHI